MSNFVGYGYKAAKTPLGKKVIEKVTKFFKPKGKVSPTITSVSPSTTVREKGIKASLDKTRSDEYRKRYTALDKSEAKVKTGKKMMQEGQKERKKMVDTGRAFQFKYSKSYHPLKPGDKDKYKSEMKVAGPQKKFKTGKELREKKMGGGMMGRRMGYSQGSNGKPISRSKNPGILAMSKTAKGRKVVKERFKFNPDRIVAKKGGKA